MPLWGWLVIGSALVLIALGALWALAQRGRAGHRPVDPALVVRDPAEQRVDQEAHRRAMEVELNDPGF
jgi:hypothetical protein